MDSWYRSSKTGRLDVAKGTPRTLRKSPAAWLEGFWDLPIRGALVEGFSVWDIFRWVVTVIGAL